ncbi:MAG: LysR family transcriptional regulator, partial [Rhodospirillales bacterium]|nr:LysR family transcriptional regulator [Rhodospirillales bacterium]
SLNTTLFHRHARGLILTEQGEVLYRTVREVFAKLSMVEGRLNDAKERPLGPLKITTTIGFGSVWMTPKLKEFLEEYPDIELSVVLADTELDLSMREADVGIRLTPPTQPDLVQRHLMTMRFHIFAAPDYLKKYGMPQTLEELDNHRIIAYGSDANPPVTNLDWLLRAGLPEGSRPRRPILKVNNVYGIFRAVQVGLGIGFLPDYLGHQGGNLVEVLPKTDGPTVDVYFVYPDELRNSKRIAVLRDFLLRKIAEGQY